MADDRNETFETFMNGVENSVRAIVVARAATIGALRRDVRSRDADIDALKQAIERNERNSVTQQSAS